jgi:hypothetical protein
MRVSEPICSSPRKPIRDPRYAPESTRGVHEEPGLVISMLVSIKPYSVTELCA